MQGRLFPGGGLGPLTPPISPEPTVKGGPDLVPVVNCGVNAQGRRFVMISIRNEGTEPTPRLFSAQYVISGRGFITGTVPISSLRPGQQVLLESTTDEILQGIPRFFVTVDADRLNLIPEDINKNNNRMVFRCTPTPVVGTSPLGM